MSFSKQSPAIQAYLLGTLDLESLLGFQRRLVYDVGGDPHITALSLCDLKPGITVGREGSREHIRFAPATLESREWDIHWLSRGGGAMLHVPGQVICYPILALEQHGLRPGDYVRKLTQILTELVEGFGVRVDRESEDAILRVRGRRLAHIGVAIRNGITSFGMVINACPDLALFREIDCDGEPFSMTSIQREQNNPIRIPAVRQRLLEIFARAFSIDRISVFHHHPFLQTRAQRHAIIARHR